MKFVEKCKAVGKVFANGFILGNFDLKQEKPIEVDTVIGCNMSFRKRLLEKAGGFDERFRGNCFREDTDISLRIRRLNYKLIFHPKAVAIHKFKGGIVSRKWFYWTVYNHTYFFLKNFKPISAKDFFEFVVVTLRPPAEYKEKTKKQEIRNKPISYFAYVFLGLINALYANLKGNPLLLEKVF